MPITKTSAKKATATPSTEVIDNSKYTYHTVSVDEFLKNYHLVTELSENDKWNKEFPTYPVYIRTESMTSDEYNDFIRMFTNQVNDNLVEFTINDDITYFEYGGIKYILNGNTRYRTLKHIMQCMESGVKEYENYAFNPIPVRRLNDDTLVTPEYLLQFQIQSNDSTNAQGIHELAIAAFNLHQAVMNEEKAKNPNAKSSETKANKAVASAFSSYVGTNRMKLSNLLAYGKFPEILKKMIVSTRVTVTDRVNRGLSDDDNDNINKGITYTTANDLFRQYNKLDNTYAQKLRETDYDISSFINDCISNSALSDGNTKNQSANILFTPKHTSAVYEMKVKEFTGKDIKESLDKTNSVSSSSDVNLPNSEDLDNGNDDKPSTKGKDPLSEELINKNLEAYMKFTSASPSDLQTLGAITQYQLLSELPTVISKILNHPDYKLTSDEEIIKSVTDNQNVYMNKLVIIIQLMNLIYSVDNAEANKELFGKILQDTKLMKLLKSYSQEDSKPDEISQPVEVTEEPVKPQVVENVAPDLSEFV